MPDRDSCVALCIFAMPHTRRSRQHCASAPLEAVNVLERARRGLITLSHQTGDQHGYMDATVALARAFAGQG
jgi:hypothetical protein